MGRILIKNGTVITMDPRRRIIRDGAVAIENDRIVDVGKAEALKDFQAEAVFDATDRIVMPGLIDAHCHNVQMLARGLGDEVDLIAWCYDRIYPYETLLTDEATYLSALLCQIEMIRTGTTCVADPGGYKMDNVGRALAETGMRGIIAWSGMDQWSEDRPLCEGLPGKLTTEETLKVEEQLVKDWNGREGGRIRACYGLRVEPNVSDALYRGINNLAKRDGVMIEMHAAVNKDQVEWVKKRTGHTVIEHMKTLGVLGDHWYLIHMAVLTDDELKMLKDNDCRVIHVPGATLHGAYGSATVGKFPELIDMGVTVALGCDSSAANNSLDMFRAMYEAATVHKEARIIPDLIAPEKAVEMATIDGARAVHWEKEIGSLEKGKKADVIIVDTKRSNWVPLHDFSLVPTLVYSGEGADVETSIIDGRVIMEKRKIKTVNVKTILRRAQRATEKLLKKLPYKLEPKWGFE
ncbi:MAG TPA: amidohydrolase [Verrucomicrobiae bacterium]|jgi:5-methylthioadenosine/S-adenosylhomocysteine deaminase|nr:amidohydrolase [Verrucomicrobiae bacterium]